MSYIIIECPHCKDEIIIMKKELNCRIFRHGIIKNTYIQMNPHESRDKCEKYKKEDLIFGCGKPFRINNKFIAEICEYI